MVVIVGEKGIQIDPRGFIRGEGGFIEYIHRYPGGLFDGGGGGYLSRGLFEFLEYYLTIYYVAYLILFLLFSKVLLYIYEYTWNIIYGADNFFASLSPIAPQSQPLWAS